MLINRMLSVFLIISLTIFIYFVIRILINLKQRNFVGAMAENLNKRYENRKVLKKAQELYEGSVNDESVISIIDNLFERSGIKTIFPFLTSEILTSITLIVALIVGSIINFKFNFWLYTLSGFIAVIFTVIFLLKFMSRITYNKIDKQIKPYINILKNLAKSNSDIVVIFEKSIPYAREPLKEYVTRFVFECKRGIPIAKAFKNFENKVENKRIKEFITNLNTSSNHNADYRKLLEKIRIIFRRYVYFKKKGQSAAKTGRFGIVAIAAFGVFIFGKMQQLTDGNVSLIEKLRGSAAGNFLLLYMLIVIIVALYVFLTLDNVND